MSNAPSIDPLLSEDTYGDEMVSDTLKSIELAQAKFDELSEQIETLRVERDVYWGSLSSLGERLERQIIRRLPFSGLVKANDGQVFLAEKVRVFCPPHPTVRKDAARKVIVEGRILTTRGKLSKGTWTHAAYLSQVKDAGKPPAQQNAE